MSQNASNALWGGRFSESTDAFVQAFTASVEFDKRMADQDIRGSKAHATMLATQGVLTESERDAILGGLDQIASEIAAGTFTWSIAREDVHMNIEARLIELIGETGKKLHTGRSRNDQVATDIRLWLRDTLDAIREELARLQTGLIDLAEREADTVMPGFTHLQAAQPISFGHHMLAWNEMLQRDQERLAQCRARLNECPLGAAALAGTSYPLDRHLSASLLGFSKPTENSLDSVSDRDFAIEFASVASIAMMHLSRFSEELVNWNSTAWQFVDLPDRFCTGSSIMPQKKNPDVPELVRGKSGRVFGHLMSLLTLMKGQPLAYNKDNQEDKEPIFDTADTLRQSLRAFADMVPAISVNRAALKAAAVNGFSTATDLADYLVRKGIPFRDAHEIVGQAVAHGVATQTDLAAMPLPTLQTFSPVIDADVYAVLTVEGSMASRDHFGGTAPNQVRAAITRARARLAAQAAQ
ncbi:MAG: argininosuccinate lyase [Gammaproteobacteria bacterium]|nr:argininosuccinate lyase [Gammaproteobacteria bacterium]